MRTSARATGTAAAECGSAIRQEAGEAGGSCKASPFMAQVPASVVITRSCFRPQEWYGCPRQGRTTGAARDRRSRYRAAYPDERPGSSRRSRCYVLVDER
ncbi:hypothetical protein GCM10010335_00950 [Streptomyces galbus]|nr:hypothetical protein GCM10010335_00950 [Streptomyces galbus]